MVVLFKIGQCYYIIHSHGMAVVVHIAVNIGDVKAFGDHLASYVLLQ